ncbi:6-phosphogluconolactonase [Rhizobiales bacterium GAS191]|jgi:6-phosphogluconolactonase|nr:6-phosphogluconolactonase [Rhizobiales bacterium GAS113]SEC00073.1 6-phosphogluconolactonase [Rhizobiales bacterium GAS188]SED22147.1 6-phosphogluconolactonase [Rhizobiales bacterium GAS191]
MKPARGSLFVYHDANALAEAAAKFLCDCASAKAGAFVVALSGGSTPKLAYETLGVEPLVARFPWARAQFVFGDERFVPPDHKDSNARMADEAMLAHVPVPLAHVHRVPTLDLGPDDAAQAYERALKALYGADRLEPGKPLLDVCLLGLGEDGHTASLIPGEPVLEEREHWVAAVGHGRPEVRITLTYPALESSAATVFLVQGEGKRAILDRILSGDDTLPAGKLRPQGDLFWLVDKAAAGRWLEAGQGA